MLAFWRKCLVGTRVWGVILAIALGIGVTGCGDRSQGANALLPEGSPVAMVGDRLNEVATPPLIAQLRKNLDAYQPQVEILFPRPDQVVADTTVAVQFQVLDLPIFKDESLQMGPHLHLFVDDQPYQAVYDVTQPFVLENLSPGTHTLRAFASRPWHESFKNADAFAQTTFHVFTKTDDNGPDRQLPLLTYSRPQGVYGAEPIMVDFYLTNAPLHFLAQESDDDTLEDWRIRVTINDETFVLKQWQPIYLEGFREGKNWVKLEYINEQGEGVKNVYNETARLLTYDPKVNDTLSKLVRGKISYDQAKAITQQPAIAPEIEVVPIPEVTEEAESSPDMAIEDTEPVGEPPAAKPETENTMDNAEGETVPTETIPEVEAPETPPAPLEMAEPETSDGEEAPEATEAVDGEETTLEPETESPESLEAIAPEELPAELPPEVPET